MKYINISILFIVVGVIIATSGCQTSSTAIYEEAPKIPDQTKLPSVETPTYDRQEEPEDTQETKVESETEEKPSSEEPKAEPKKEEPKPEPKKEEPKPEPKNITGNELVGITGAFLPSSGFFINDKGLLLTSTIVNKSTTAVTVVDGDSQSTAGEIIGFSEFSNIAVIQTTGKPTYEYLNLSTETFFPAGTKVKVVRTQCGSCPVGYQTLFETTILSTSVENNISTLQLNTSLDSSFEGGPVLDSNNDVIGVITFPLDGIVSKIRSSDLNKMSLGSKIFQPSKPEDILGADFSQATTPPFPVFFSGAASINGIPVSDGTLIYARVENYISEAVTTSNGKYSFLKIGPPTDLGFLNEKVLFYIDGFITDQTGIYQTSMNDPLTKLDLSANVANYP